MVNKNHQGQRLLGKKILSRFCFTLEVINLSGRDYRVRTQGRNLVAGNEAEVIDEYCLLADSFIWLSLTVHRTNFHVNYQSRKLNRFLQSVGNLILLSKLPLQ